MHASEDGAEVTSPVSLTEWYLNFYAHKTCGGTVAPVEFTARPGDVVFIPSGWWHAVYNLEPTIAITSNFCSTHNVRSVLSFLRVRPLQVSGVPPERRAGLHAAFTAALGCVDALPTEEPQVPVSAARRCSIGVGDASFAFNF